MIPVGASLKLAGVGKRYGLRQPWVLDRITLDVPPGTLLRIEGPNGCGKSTLLRLIAGIGRPTRGRVDQPRRRAYVPERFAADLPITLGSYLAHLGAVQGLSTTVAVERAGFWLERLGAAAWAANPMGTLSKGTAQKAALAAALVGEPDLLVLDEAWTGLDVAARLELDRAVDERLAAGAIVVFVDHDVRRLAGRATTSFAIDQGVLAARGPAGGVSPADSAEGLVEIEFETADGAGRVLSVAVGEVDRILREVLAEPGAHICAVRPTEPKVSRS